MSTTDVISVLESIENLPTLPVVAQQILKLVTNKNSNMSQIATVITKDQAIAARIIRLTNSAFYGLRNRITSIQHAIVILGLNTVKNLVLGVSVVKAFEDTARMSVFDREKFWLHSFSTAQASKLMAKKMGIRDDEDFFLSGLLHDIGILIVDQFLHDDFMEIMKNVVEHKSDYMETEKAVLGMNHGDIGAYIGEKWKIHTFLIHAVRYHHRPKSIPPEAQIEKDKVNVVHVAESMMRENGVGDFMDNFSTKVDEEIKQGLKISSEDLKGIVDQVREDSKSLMREWGM